MGQKAQMKIMIAPALHFNSNEFKNFIKIIFKNLYFRESKDQTLLINLENIPDQLLF
jgi:hypothetical protein